MKLIVFSILMVFSVSAFSNDKSSGCGLGWKFTTKMTTSGSSTRNLTHATSSNTFAMTSGTSGCDQHGLIVLQKTKIHYIESNMIPLQFEVAQGNGERLNAAGQVFGCNLGNTRFNSLIKSNYYKIFSQGLDANHIVNQIDEIVSTDKELKGQCQIRS